MTALSLITDTGLYGIIEFRCFIACLTALTRGAYGSDYRQVMLLYLKILRVRVA